MSKDVIKGAIHYKKKQKLNILGLIYPTWSNY